MTFLIWLACWCMKAVNFFCWSKSLSALSSSLSLCRYSPDPLYCVVFSWQDLASTAGVFKRHIPNQWKWFLDIWCCGMSKVDHRTIPLVSFWVPSRTDFCLFCWPSPVCGSGAFILLFLPPWAFYFFPSTLRFDHSIQSWSHGGSKVAVSGNVNCTILGTFFCGSEASCTMCRPCYPLQIRLWHDDFCW